MAKIDLSEFLTNSPSLSEFLPKDEGPSESLSAPELVELRWLKQICSCGREYSSQENTPLVRYTLSRRQGFGLRVVGKVFIPLMPNADLSEIPCEVRINTVRISHCIECFGQKPSLPLFPEFGTSFLVSKNGTAASPQAAAWLEMHKTAKNHDVEATLKDMHKRNVDFDEVLSFRTTTLDLQNAVANVVACDPETQIES